MSATGKVIYRVEATLSAAEFSQVLVDSGLGASRPIDDADRLTQILNASLTVTARLGEAETSSVSQGT